MIDNLYQRLQNSQAPSTPNELMILHVKIFKTGTMIYFHRQILNATPKTLLPWTSDLLHSLAEYRKLGGGWVTLWPVFLEAVEVYQDSQKAAVRECLDSTEMMDARGRREVRKLVEAVWQRSVRREQLGNWFDEGDIVVDWRHVMRDKGWDILLI